MGPIIYVFDERSPYLHLSVALIEHQMRRVKCTNHHFGVKKIFLQENVPRHLIKAKPPIISFLEICLQWRKQLGIYYNPLPKTSIFPVECNQGSDWRSSKKGGYKYTVSIE